MSPFMAGLDAPTGGIMQYAKSIVAILGSAVTAALGLVPERSTLWIILTIIAAALTTAGVYAVPNSAPAQTPKV